MKRETAGVQGKYLRKTLEIGEQIKIHKTSAVSNGREIHFCRVSSSG